MMRKTLLAVLVSGLMVTGVQAAENQVNGYLFGNVARQTMTLAKCIKECLARWMKKIQLSRWEQAFS